MSIPPPPPPPLRLRSLPKQNQVLLELLNGNSKDRSYDRFLKLRIDNLLDKLSTAEDLRITYVSRQALNQAWHAARLSCYRPGGTPDDEPAVLLPLVLYCADILHEGSLEQVLFWLDTIDDPATACELRQLADRFYSWPREPVQQIEQLERCSPAERARLVEQTLAGLRFLCLQASTDEIAGQPIAADVPAGDDHEQPREQRSFWQKLKEFFRGIPQEEMLWPSYAQPDWAPKHPKDGYRVVVAEKVAGGDTITFICSAYRFSRRHGWFRVRRLFIPGVDDSLQASFDSTTEVDKLAEAWADWVNAVAAVNERRYQNMLDRDEAARDAQASKQLQTQKLREQLQESVDLASVLSGPTLVQQPQQQR